MRCAKEWLPLYAVTDRSWLDGRPFHEVAEAALRGGVTCLQLREKELEHESFLREAISLKKLCDKYQVPLIIDDEVGIAIESRAAGVHIGQQDEPAAEVRRRLGPNMLLGVSAQTVEQAVKAEREGADYLGVGAVFPTGTKLDAEDVSYDTLKGICEAVSIPVVAIGGIKKDNLALLSGSGIDGVAVVSSIFAAPEAETAARALRAAVRIELGV